MNKRIYFLFGLLFLVLATAIYLHRKSLMELDKDIELIDRSHEITSSFENLSSDLEIAQEHAQAAPSNAQSNILANNFVDIISDIQLLRTATADFSQQRKLDSLLVMVNNWRQSLAETANSSTSGLVLENKIKNNFLQTQDIVNRCIARQRALFIERQTNLKIIVKSLNRWTILLIGMGFLLVILTTLYAYRQMKNRIDLEALLESILNASQEGIITCKTCREGFKIEDFEILFANSAVKTHFGQEPSQLIGKSILYLMPEIRTSGLFAKWIQVVEDGMPDEYEARHKDELTGKDNWYSIKLVKLEDGVTVTFHNITELKSYKQNIVMS